MRQMSLIPLDGFNRLRGVASFFMSPPPQSLYIRAIFKFTLSLGRAAWRAIAMKFFLLCPIRLAFTVVVTDSEREEREERERGV